MNITAYVEDKRTSEFYPTPESLIEKMCWKINWNFVQTVLEPSAGKGDIVKYINRRNENKQLDIDCIELDNNLRQVILYTFSEENSDKLFAQKKEIIDRYPEFDQWSKDYKYYNRLLGKYVPVPDVDRMKLRAIDNERKAVKGENIHLIHDNFLTFTAYKQYNLIIMNPPFSNGDKHLLKALEIQKYGGQIVCLLNAETIRNPYTETRKELASLLNEYNADIEYITDSFTDAERSTDVEIALIYVNIPIAVNNSDDSIFDKLSQSEKYHEPTPEEVTALDVTDYMKSIVNRYKVEIKSGIELINAYERMKPYLLNSFDNQYSYPIMQLMDSAGKDKITVNKYVKGVRYKYWKALFSNPKFTGKLTSKLQEQYRTKVETFANYDFSEFNIKNLLVEMNSKVKSCIESEIEKMFDKLTEEYACSEGSSKKYMYNAWKTNIGYKIDKKVILPFYGLYDSIFGRIDFRKVDEKLGDVERILNYFDGNMTEDVDIYETVKQYVEQGITKNIPLKFFSVTLYKKGSVHITFNCPDLIQKYNIYVGKQRRWLPNDYGTKGYKDMTAEEKSVIDSFQGEKEYNKIMANKAYYLGGITHQTMNMIGMDA